VIGMLAVLGLAAVGPIHHLHAIARDFGTAHHAAAPQPPDCHEEHARHGQVPPPHPADKPVYCPVCTLGKMTAAFLPASAPTLAVPFLPVDPPVAIATAAPVPLRVGDFARPRAPPAKA
jgi:hypothetical protein